MPTLHQVLRTKMRLFLFQLGMHPFTGVPVPGYLVQQGRYNILIDTGFAPLIPPFRYGPRRFRVTPEDHILARLGSVGIAAQDIHYVVCSHFDPDHCGANDSFPNARFIVQRAQYEIARSGSYSRFEVQRKHWDVPSLVYERITADVELLPGLELIETSGHVPGHQSVLVRLDKQGPTLLTIDAITAAPQNEAAFRRRHEYNMDPERADISARKLRNIIATDQVELVIYGHDAIQWPGLRKAPEYYE